jgi:phenylalanine ammonia-lyase
MHEEEVSLKEDRYSLKQDRYPLRTAPQFLGPQLEDILAAHATVTLECNTSKSYDNKRIVHGLMKEPCSHRQSSH